MKVRRGRGPFFARVPWDLQDDPNVDAQAIAVYAALQRYADFGGVAGARVPDKVAATKAKVSVRTFIDRRQQLARLGWIDWDSGKGTGKANDYLVHQSLGGSAPDADPAAPEGMHGVHTPSAPGADPGTHGAQAPSIDREPSTDSHTEKVPFSAKPYIDQHQLLLPGSVVTGGEIAAVFSGLEIRAAEVHPTAEPAQRTATILNHQRRYIEHMKATGSMQYFSYANFAKTFSEWGSKKRGARTVPAGSDLRDGMEALNR